MKNIHLISTDKPSRIYLIKKNNKLGITSADPEFTENFGSGTQNQYTYITSDEEINANTKPCWCINTIKNTWDKDVIYYQGSMPQYHFIGFKKIVLTTDQKLIDDGIQSIDDDFLNWFVKNQSCEEVEVQCRYNFYVGQDLTHYKIIIPKEEPISFPFFDKEKADDITKEGQKVIRELQSTTQQETIEETAERLLRESTDYQTDGYSEYQNGRFNGIIEGIKWQAERMYIEEDIKFAYEQGARLALISQSELALHKGKFPTPNEWLEQFKK